MPGANDEMGRGPHLCAVTMGFRAKFEEFRAIDTDQISILQVAVRKTARVYKVKAECELRIAPENVRLLTTRVEERGPVVVR